MLPSGVLFANPESTKRYLPGFYFGMVIHDVGVMEKLSYWNVHYSDVIMGAMASRITSLTIVNSTFYSGADQRKH